MNRELVKNAAACVAVAALAFGLVLIARFLDDSEDQRDNGAETIRWMMNQIIIQAASG